jgi:hypothetical protein
MGGQPLGVLRSISTSQDVCCLHENMTLSWRGMEAAHLKIPKHFLLNGYMQLSYLSYQILRLVFLYRGLCMCVCN